jgi:putative two-component system response regulator
MNQKRTPTTEEKNMTRPRNGRVKTMNNLVEYRDAITGSHVDRTELFLRILVNAMLEKQTYSGILHTWDMASFFQSVHLHDVGKIAISRNILLKPSRLSAEEFEEMKKHTTFGERIIEKIQRDTNESAFLTHAKMMTGSHHEKWDGSGYPRGLSEANIPLQSRLMAIADVYDALVSERPYKKPMSPADAAEVIAEEKGRHFDPAIADCFLSARRKFQAAVMVLASSYHSKERGSCNAL